MAVLHRGLRSRQRGSTFVKRLASHKRVLSYGCYPFLSGRSGKPFGLPWQAFRPQRRASLATSNRSAVALSQSLTTPFADPFAGLKDRNLRDGESYTEKNFSRQSFVCFIFFGLRFAVTPGPDRAIHSRNSYATMPPKRYPQRARSPFLKLPGRFKLRYFKTEGF